MTPKNQTVGSISTRWKCLPSENSLFQAFRQRSAAERQRARKKTKNKTKQNKEEERERGRGRQDRTLTPYLPQPPRCFSCSHLFVNLNTWNRLQQKPVFSYSFTVRYYHFLTPMMPFESSQQNTADISSTLFVLKS